MKGFFDVDIKKEPRGLDGAFPNIYETLFKELQQMNLYKSIKNKLTMKTRLIAFLSIILTSCINFLDEEHFEVDPRLRVHADRFYSEANKREIFISRDVIIRIERIGGDRWGTSSYGPYGAIPHIVIDDEFVNSNQDKFKQSGDSTLFYRVELIVFHELGHALLYKEHEERESIMQCCSRYIDEFAKDRYRRASMISDLFKK